MWNVCPYCLGLLQWHWCNRVIGPARWRHQVETVSALLAICVGNSPVTGEFPAQRPVTRSFDVFFDLRLDKPLSKQSWCWWFETPLRSLWCQCNDTHRSGLTLARAWRQQLSHYLNQYWLVQFVLWHSPMAISQKGPMNLIRNMCSKIAIFKIIPHLSGADEFTHWSRVTHLLVSKQDHYWFRLWLVTWLAPNHFLNHCWNICSWTFANKFQWIF